MEGGGANTQWRAADQQQPGTQPTCSPPLLRGVGAVQGDRPAAASAATPHYRQVWQQQPPGGTQQQQQQQQCLGTCPTQLANHTFNLYRECVVAGQWARISIEQRPDGEHISLFCRPASAAAAGTAAAASRGKKRSKQPNQRRAAKQQLWRDKHSRRRDTATSQQQQPQQQRGATAYQEQQQQCSNHETPQQQLGLQNAATGPYAAAAAN